MMSEKVMMEPTAGSGTSPTNDETLRVVSNERIRERLKKVAAIAEAALANQPNEDGPCWEHMVLALGRIETEMLIHTAEKPEGNPPAESAEVAENAEPKKKKAVGNFAGAGKVVSYAIDEMYAVTVTANTTGDGAWMFKGIKNGETEIIGTIIGGKWKAMQYCKFIRNGIVSRANRLYHAHHKAKKAAAALADARPDGTEAAQ